MEFSNEGPRMYTVGEAATIMRVSTKTLRKWIAMGAIPAIRIGRWVRIVPDDLLEAIEARKLRPHLDAHRTS